MKTSPEKDLPQGEALSQWEFKPSSGSNKGVDSLFPFLLFLHHRAWESGKGPVNVMGNDTAKGEEPSLCLNFS